MKFGVKKMRARATFWLLVVGLCFAGTVLRAQLPLSAEDITRRMLERSESTNSADHSNNYLYQKHTVTEDLDSKGRLKDRKEKLYEVTVQSGISYLKLLQINGEKLSPAEVKKQSDRDAEERAKITDSNAAKKGDNRENFLTADLLARFKFTLQPSTSIGGRSNYVVTFEPKSETLPVKKLTDRFLNNVAGKVWIDMTDFEITKAEVHLRTEITLWGGVLGTLRRCDYTLMRTRQADGVWLNSFSHGVFEGRKLLETMSIKTMSESSNFRKLALADEPRIPGKL